MVNQHTLRDKIMKLESYDRVHVITDLIRLSNPLELEFYSTVIEGIMQYHKNDMETIKAECNTTCSLPGDMDEAVNSNSRLKLITLISLLRHSNFSGAEKIFDFLSKNKNKFKYLAENNSSVYEEVLLIYELAVDHPAFNIDQCQEIHDYLNEIRSLPVNKKMHRKLGNEIVIDILVVSTEKTFDFKYIYEIEVQWNTYKCYIYRTLEDIYLFYRKIFDLFSVEMKNGEICGLTMSLFDNLDYARSLMNEFFKEFLQSPDNVMRSDLVRAFLQPSGLHDRLAKQQLELEAPDSRHVEELIDNTLGKGLSTEVEETMSHDSDIAFSDTCTFSQCCSPNQCRLFSARSGLCDDDEEGSNVSCYDCDDDCADEDEDDDEQEQDHGVNVRGSTDLGASTEITEHFQRSLVQKPLHKLCKTRAPFSSGSSPINTPSDESESGSKHNSKIPLRRNLSLGTETTDLSNSKNMRMNDWLRKSDRTITSCSHCCRRHKSGVAVATADRAPAYKCCRVRNLQDWLKHARLHKYFELLAHLSLCQLRALKVPQLRQLGLAAGAANKLVNRLSLLQACDIVNVLSAASLTPPIPTSGDAATASPPNFALKIRHGQDDPTAATTTLFSSASSTISSSSSSINQTPQTAPLCYKKHLQENRHKKQPL